MIFIMGSYRFLIATQRKRLSLQCAKFTFVNVLFYYILFMNNDNYIAFSFYLLTSLIARFSIFNFPIFF